MNQNHNPFVGAGVSRLSPRVLCLRATEPGARYRGAHYRDNAWPHGGAQVTRGACFGGCAHYFIPNGFFCYSLGFSLIYACF
jgi:hypothetical protein